MTVKQLIDMLKDLPQDFYVVLASDPEGNIFWDASIVTEGFYDTIEFTDDPDDLDESDKNAICIWP